MEEIEVKILNVDRKSIEGKLISLGAQKIFDDEVVGVYFDFDDNALRKTKDLIRLRKEGEKAILTFKKFVKHAHAKMRNEYEVEVSDFETTQSILEFLGLSQWLVTTKHRTSYALDDVHFEFDKYHDKYEFIPEFLEIEAKDFDTIVKSVELLGLRKEDCKPWTLVDVAEYYLSDTK